MFLPNTCFRWYLFSHTPVVETGFNLNFFLPGLLLQLFQSVSPNRTGPTLAGARLGRNLRFASAVLLLLRLPLLLLFFLFSVSKIGMAVTKVFIQIGFMRLERQRCTELATRADPVAAALGKSH